ncbi:MAG: hypothetical protein M1541_19035 [Acidobacteria bacterium]|nr:hypothetical protein [Acidobacteriota bacterium]
MRINALLPVFFAAVLACTVSVSAQARTKTSKAETVTGCLQKGAEPNEPNEFQLMTPSGKVYGVSSSTVKLADHVGHEVTVTGHQIKEKGTTGTGANTGATANTGTSSANKEVMDINVTKLKMVNNTCR